MPVNPELFSAFALAHHRAQVTRQRLMGTAKKVHPGSKAEARVAAELKAAETECGLWEGRMEDIKEAD